MKWQKCWQVRKRRQSLRNSAEYKTCCREFWKQNGYRSDFDDLWEWYKSFVRSLRLILPVMVVFGLGLIWRSAIITDSMMSMNGRLCLLVVAEMLVVR